MDINFKINAPESQEKWTKASTEYYRFRANSSKDKLNHSVTDDLVSLNDAMNSFIKLETHIVSAMKAKIVKKISKSRIQLIRNSFINFAYDIDELILRYNEHRFANAMNINKYVRIEDEVSRILDEQFREILSSEKEFMEYSQYEKIICQVANGIYMNLKSITTNPKLFSFEDRGEICYILEDISRLLMSLNGSSIFSIKYEDSYFDDDDFEDPDADETVIVEEDDKESSISNIDLKSPEVLLELEKMDMFNLKDEFHEIINELVDDLQNDMTKFFDCIKIFHKRIKEKKHELELVNVDDRYMRNDEYKRNIVRLNDRIDQNAEFLSKVYESLRNARDFVINGFMEYIVNLKCCVALIVTCEEIISNKE